MDIYTLDSNFVRQELIEESTSVVWTTRYLKNGDFTITVPDSTAARTKFAVGVFLEHDNPMSQITELMVITTSLAEKGILKVTGATVDIEILDNIILRNSASHDDKHWAASGAPQRIMADAVFNTAVTGGAWTHSGYGIDGAKQIVPNFYLTRFSFPDPVVNLAVPFGSLYEALKQIAESYQIGFQVYFDRISPFPGQPYTLYFHSWQGRDLTSSQSVFPVVKFSPAMDSIRDLKELRSRVGYKNVAYAFAPSSLEGLATEPGVAYVDNGVFATGLARRSIMVTADDITTDKVGGSAATLLDLLNQKAKDALANNNYVKMIDGEIVPQETTYLFERDYFLGDIIELDGGTGLSQKARITEYIRSVDSSGERSYPTVSVID